MIPVSVTIIVAVIMKETPTEKAYRACEDCGHDESWVDMVIENYQGSGLKPAEAIQLLKDTSEAQERFELCKPCVQAVIKAAEK